MNPVALRGMLSELEKIAKTRAAREAQKALAAGDVGGAKDIAQAYKKLELSPRYLKDVSPGGVEGAVDLLMGHHQGMDPDASGLIARKMYKPDSWMATGERMGEALEQKKRFVDKMRSLSPEARAMTPAMYGHQAITGKGPEQLNVSYHEYVDNLKKMRQGDRRVHSVLNKVLNPMAEQGMQVHDVVLGQAPGFGLFHHPENLMRQGDTPKILDIWPHEFGKPNPIEQFAREHGGRGDLMSHDWNFAPSILGIKPNEPAGKEESAMYLQGLRKKIFGKPGQEAFGDEKQIAKKLLKQKKKRLGAQGLHRWGERRRAKELAGIAGVRLPDKAPSAAGKLLKGMRKHPLATGLIAAGALGAGGAAYLHHKRKKQHAEHAAHAEGA